MFQFFEKSHGSIPAQSSRGKMGMLEKLLLNCGYGYRKFKSQCAFNLQNYLCETLL